jgi:hypothetical protein
MTIDVFVAGLAALTLIAVLILALTGQKIDSGNDDDDNDPQSFA